MEVTNQNDVVHGMNILIFLTLSFPKGPYENSKTSR